MKQALETVACRLSVSSAGPPQPAGQDYRDGPLGPDRFGSRPHDAHAMRDNDALRVAQWAGKKENTALMVRPPL